MKFLIDMSASPALVAWLEAKGHEAIHAQDAGLATAPDGEILAKAQAEDRIIVTVDLDFGRLLALMSVDKPGVILFRGGNYSELEMRQLLGRVLTAVDPETLQHAIAVVDKQRVRVTRLPLQRP